MKTLTIISQKGGAGKTTIALFLAVASASAGKSTAIVDLDPQSSAAIWGDSRESDNPVVVSAQASRLDKVLEAAESNGAELAILDTAPHSERDALAAVRLSDFVLIPCRPAILDIRAIVHSVDLVKLARKEACVVLNAVPPRGNLANDAAQAIAAYDVPVCPITIGQRAAYSNALTLGLTAQEYEPSGKASEEIHSLYLWLCQQLNM